MSNKVIPVTKNVLDSLAARNQVINHSRMTATLLERERELYLRSVMKDMELDDDVEWRFSDVQGGFVEIEKEKTDE